jgi:hypothetical protein
MKKVTAGEAVDKYEEILIHEDRAHLLGIFYFCR